MKDLNTWRTRHRELKIQLLNLSKKIVSAEDLDDKLFYQEICELYAQHIRKIETDCYGLFGVSICSCGFHPEHCDK